MAITDQKLNELQKEKAKLIKANIKNEENKEYKRQLKNLNERIRVRTKKVLEENNPKPTKKLIKPNSTKIIDIIKAEIKNKNTNPKEIAKKHNLKIKSVRWYIWKIKKTN